MQSVGTDPGWPPLIPSFLRVLLGALGVRRRPVADPSILSMLRSLYLGFAEAAIVIALIVAGLELFVDREVDVASGPVLLAVAGVGTLAIALGSQVKKELDWSAADPLARSFATRFFVRIAAADAAVVAGFVGYLVSANPVAFVVGAFFGILGFIRAAPTEGQIDDDQTSTRPTGSNLRLLDALLQPPPSDTPSTV